MIPSQGKRATKRKRKDGPIIKHQSAGLSEEGSSERSTLVLRELQDHLTIGFNTTTRFLEFLARKSSPRTDENLQKVLANETSASLSLDTASTKPLAAVFVPHSGQPSVLYSHLPLLCKAASLAIPSSPSIRIILLPDGAEDRLKRVLGIPRVGLIGLIDGVPKASSLIELIRQCVPELEVPWLQEAVKGAHLSVNINTIQTDKPLRPKKRRVLHYQQQHPSTKHNVTTAC